MAGGEGTGGRGEKNGGGGGGRGGGGEKAVQKLRKIQGILACAFPLSPGRQCSALNSLLQAGGEGLLKWAFSAKPKAGGEPVLFIGIRFLPKSFAAEVQSGLRFDGAIALDGALAGKAQVGFVADGRERHAHESEFFNDSLGAQVFAPFFDDDATGAARAMA